MPDLLDLSLQFPDAHGASSRKLLGATSSEGLRIASQVTTHRLKQLLLAKGPSPIRNITRQLAIDLPGFDHFSVSKQRRLIMSVLELLVPPVFEKIGWGSWAVIDESRSRRESITNPHTLLHNLSLPNEVNLDDTGAIMSDSDEEEDSLSDEYKHHESPEVFHFDEDKKPSAAKRPDHFEGTSDESKFHFANRVPLNLHTPSPDHLSTGGIARRRKLSSAALVAKPAIRHSLFNRSRLNLLENLEGYILTSARSSWGSPPPALQRSLGTPVDSPSGSFTELPAAIMPRQKEVKAYNESHMRSTLNHKNDSDTDEEDWETLGPDSHSLSKRTDITNPASAFAIKPEGTPRSLEAKAKQSRTLPNTQQRPNIGNKTSLTLDEDASAAHALVGLRST